MLVVHNGGYVYVNSVRKLISFEFNGEVNFEVLFCSAQLEGSMLLIYRNEKGVDCTASRGLDLQWR